MPSCCIQNCKSHTARNATPKNIKYFYFPREIAVRQQWLNACQRKESEIGSARICSIHFKENCYALVKTKPRLINDPVKEILRLKEGSIPTEFLNLEKKRRGRMSQSKEDNKKIKVPKQGIDRIDDNLMQLKMSEQRNLKLFDKNQNLEKRIRDLSKQVAQLQAKIKNMTKNIDKVATQNIEEQSKAIKQQIKQGINDNTNYVHVKTLSMQLRELKELNRKLSDKNKILEKRIRDLSTQVAQLQAEIKNMKNKHKEVKTTVIDALHKIIERLSSEDIARADSL
ncbi:uncharacterized protein [Temnothorax nylanderi]|uniref:uncharacterized protein n=1 Tax=Temnothorax nylanderi TaxID=102681 RepID=UPI003A87D399